MFNNVDRTVLPSMIYGLLVVRSHEFTYARAGHNPLLIKRKSNGEVEYRTPGGLGLGLDRGKIFDEVIAEEKIKIGKGDTILLYTDGVVESMNANHVEFGEERLMNIISHQDKISSESGCQQILNDIKAFSIGTEQFDDITMVIAKRLA